MSNQLQNVYRTPPAPLRQPAPAASLPLARWSWRETSICVFLVMIVVTAYFTVWKFEFVYFDDPGYVSENLDVLRGLPLFTSFEDFKKSVYWAFTAFEQSNWHPLTWMSHMLDVQIFQHWAGGHHLTNILLHSLNSVLVFALFWRMTGKAWRSAVVAAMFAVHPMHVESVAWVAERKDVLSTFLGLLTLHAYVTYSRSARFSGGFFLFSAVTAAITGMLAWLWYNLCFWYMQQLNWFQLLRLKPADDVLKRFDQQAQFLRSAGFTVSPSSPDWYSQLSSWADFRGGVFKVLPVAYDGFSLSSGGLVWFGAALILALLAFGAYAVSSGRTRLLKYCATMLAFSLVGMIMLAGIWFARGSANEFAGGQAHRWINGFGGAVVLLGFVGGAVAAALQRRAVAMQCAVFGCSVAGLMIVLHWIAQLPPPPPPPTPDWYTNPLQTVVERIWCSEFAVGLFVVFGSLAADAVLGHRRNALLFSVVIVLYVVGLLAKPMLVTLPFVMLLLDFWPLGRMDVRVNRQNEKPAQPSGDALRASRRRTRQKRKQPAPAYTQSSSATTGFALGPTLLRVAFLVLEKAPLLALAAASGMVTPIAQSHGGSMASANDLPVWFRIQNATKSFDVYIGKMFWPGRMMSLHLLAQDAKGQPYVEPSLFWLAVVVMAVLSAVAIAAFFLGRRYVTFGWLWYVGILVPVIGFVQVGEQRWADRYTYVSYVGLFVAIVWSIADLMDRFPQWRRWLQCTAAGGMICILASWIPWTNYQTQTWHDRERHLRHALTVEPDNWNMLNNLGVHLWKSAQDEDRLAAQAESQEKTQDAASHHQKSNEFKDSAIESWLHGITARPTATDIWSNLGYMYSERNQLDEAEKALTKAVQLKEISPRPHNNLGRVLLRRSQERENEAAALENKAKEAEAKVSKTEAAAADLEAKAREAQAKGTADPAEAAKVPKMNAEAEALRRQAPQLKADAEAARAEANARIPDLKKQAKEKLDQAVDQFERSVQLDASLLEARLNLGEVYTQLGNYDKANYEKAKVNYEKILDLDHPGVVETDAINNFSQAHFGLARIAFAQDKPDEGFAQLKMSLERNRANRSALELLARQLFLHDRNHEGEQVVWELLARLAPRERPVEAERLGGQFMNDKKLVPQTVRAWGIASWIFATSPDLQLRNPQAALALAQRILQLTKAQDPLALDTFAAAAAATGHFDDAVRAANQAVSLANSQGNKALADQIRVRLSSYERRTPYASRPDGSDRP